MYYSFMEPILNAYFVFKNIKKRGRASARKEFKMKNRKNIVAVLAVLILRVSAMVLFTACDHYYQYRLAGVWEVKKATVLGISVDLPIEISGIKEYTYLYFTRDGKGGIAKKIVGGGKSSLSKYD